MIYVARGSFWSTFNFIASSLFSTLLVIGFGNLVPKEVYGNYKYIMSLAGALGFIMFVGINTAVTQSAASGKIGSLSYAIKTQLRWNVLFTLTLLGVAGYYFFNDHASFAIAFIILAAGNPLVSTFNTYGAFLAGRKEFKRASLYASMTTFFYVLCMFTAIVVSADLIVLVGAYIIGSLVPLLYFHWKVVRSLPPHDPLSAQEEKELVSYARHLNVLNIFGNLSQYVDKIVVFHYMGAVELAIYGFALAVPERIRGYLKNITALALPKLSERSLEDISLNFYRRIFQGMLIGSLISIGYVVGAPIVFKLLLPKYLEAVHYSQIIGISYIFLLPGTYIGDIFKAQKMIRALYLSSLGGHITRIALFVLLGARWGIWGVIAASQIVIVLGFFYNIILWEIERKRIRTL